MVFVCIDRKQHVVYAEDSFSRMCDVHIYQIK